MSKFEKLAEAFDENKKKNDLAGSAPPDDVDALKRSLAVISAIDKLQAQGVTLNKKAKLDYILALKFVEHASKMSGKDYLEEYQQRQALLRRPDVPPPSPAKPKIPDSGGQNPKRDPTHNPEEFKEALESSKKVIAQVEQMQRDGKPISVKLMETYSLCKKFLAKYS